MPKKTNDGKISSTSRNCRTRVWRRKKSNMGVRRWQERRTAVRLSCEEAAILAERTRPAAGRGRRWWVLRGSNPRPTPCKGAALPAELSTRAAEPARHQLSASLSALPGRNLGTLAALILIAAPVRGLRPLRAARLPTAERSEADQRHRVVLLQASSSRRRSSLQCARGRGLGDVGLLGDVLDQFGLVHEGSPLRKLVDQMCIR